MKCYICDREMADVEIQFIPETKSFDCCAVCLEIAMETAYCDGIVKPDNLEEPVVSLGDTDYDI